MNRRFLTALLACVGILVLVAGASAQESGHLNVFVFEEGAAAPMTDVLVSVGGQDEVAGDDGLARFELSPGEYEIAAQTSSGTKHVLGERVPVTAGETTEVLLTTHPGAAPTADIEAPVAAATSAVADAAPTGPPGVIEGHVTKVDTDEAVEGARVFVRGAAGEARTDADGRFTLTLPPGTHTLSILHGDFDSRTVDGVEVKSGETTPFDVELTPSSLALADYTVTAPHVEGGLASMLETRKNANAVSDVIGAEQISKSGDSSAASALKRVTGLTVVGGKYVYVRGMGERYSSTLLNGASLPSPEPERRVVPLDMFPTDMLSSVIVQKTYSPDLPGEFGGGAVILQTRGVPDQFVGEVSVSGGYLTGTTGERGLMGESGSTDWLGIDDGSRDLPGSVQNATADQALLEGDRFSNEGYSAEELEEFGEDMPRNWGVHREEVPYDYGMSATVGSPFHPWGIPMGILGGVTYGNDWDLTKSHRNYYIVGAGDELELQHGYDFETLEHSIDLGGIVTAGINPSDNHKILSTTMLIRTTDNENRIYHGRNRDAGTVIRVTRQRWLERELFVQQLTGEHTIPVLANLGIDWRYTFSKAKRDEPDRRETRYDLVENTGAYILSDRPEGNQRLFSYLEDENHDLGLDLSMPFKDWRGLEAKAKVGAAYVTRERKVDTRRFKYQHKGPLSTDPDVISKPADEIFVPENIGPDGFQFEEITRPTDNYSAEQEITAVYAMADLPILEPWRVIGGARYEESTQKLETFELFNPNSEPIEADLASDDILPAVNMTYALTDEMLVRAAYSKTISRPDFRELSPATFNDVTGGRQIFGNENLDRTLIENLDARWEWYPSNDQSLSFGAFYKLFQDPIEQIVVPSAQQSVTFENADEATNWGLELDFRNNYGFVANWAEDLYTAGNLSWIESKVKLGDDVGVQTEDERPLQGQSPYVINLMLGYDNLDSGTSASVLYNVFGPRIDQVGAQGAPDIIEEPFHQLDLVASQSLPYGFKIKAKAQNLLDLEARKMQDDEIVERYFKGRAFSLSLSWRY